MIFNVKYKEEDYNEGTTYAVIGGLAPTGRIRKDLVLSMMTFILSQFPEYWKIVALLSIFVLVAFLVRTLLRN